MSLFRKSNKKVSSRQQLQIKEVLDDILILPDCEYRLMVEASSINFELKSEKEQDIIIDNFQNFLNALPTKVQVLIRVRELDIDYYLEQIQTKRQQENEEIFKEHLDNYASFIQKLITRNKILSRRFFIIIPYHATSSKEFSFVKEQLYLNRDIIVRGLEKLGMKIKTLHTLELLDLFYSFYNQNHIKTQPLKQEALAKQTYVPFS